MAFNPASATTNFGFQDGFQTTLSAAITTTTQLTASLTSLPTPTEGSLVIEPGTANEEEIYFTSSGAGVVNIPSSSAGRGVNGTAVTHNSGVAVKMLWTKASADVLKYLQAAPDASVKSRHLATDAITLGYAEATSNQTVPTNALTDITSLSVTVTVPAGGRRILVTGFTGTISNSSASDQDSVELQLREGATLLNRSGNQLKINDRRTFIVNYCVAATAGSHTYKLALKNNINAATVIESGSTAPNFILVQLI